MQVDFYFPLYLFTQNAKCKCTRKEVRHLLQTQVKFNEKGNISRNLAAGKATIGKFCRAFCSKKYKISND